MVVLRTEIVFSMKLTPKGCSTKNNSYTALTQRLDIVLIETALDILDHQTRFPNLRVTDHSDLDHDAATVRFQLIPPIYFPTCSSRPCLPDC